MFDHVTIRVSNRAASERFYDTVLEALGIEKTASDEWYAEWDVFSLAEATDERPVTRNLHLGFAAPSREHVDAFWRAGTEAGYRDDGAPGPRPQYVEDYYGGFLLDPDGNSAEAVHHGAMRGGMVDHLWIRVTDLAAARAFYDPLAPHTGFRLASEEPGYLRFQGAGGSFSLLDDGAPHTEHLHVAFPADDDATVEAFHRASLEAGGRDNGGPGERPEYHEGYFSAFVLDPAGHNIEVVNHNRG